MPQEISSSNVCLTQYSHGASCFADKISRLNDKQRFIICDLQTSGGLLIAVSKDQLDEVLAIASARDETLFKIGQMLERREGKPLIGLQ